MRTSARPTPPQYRATLASLLSYAALGGYYGGTRPAGAGFRSPFSYHPLLMMVGFVGLMGSAHLTKKLGGYANTKIHAGLATAGLAIAFGGLYAIYLQKEALGKDHVTSYHAWAGMVALVGTSMPALAGALLLHPDYGLDRTNKLYRFGHKVAGRLFTAVGWASCVAGLAQLRASPIELVLFGAPMVVMACLVLL